MSQPITLGVTDLSFHHVTGSLVAHVLTEMGLEVERVRSPHEANFQKLKSGEVDLLASAWLPSSHGGYKAEVERTVPLLELGLHYQPYALWGVPEYVPADEVREIADLLKPDVIAKLNRDIQGINPGAGITRFSIQMMDEYGLNEAGYQFHPGTEEDCFGAFERAVETKQWLVVPLWKPQFLHHQHAIRELVEPKGLLGTVDKAVLLLRQDKQSMFSKDQLQTLDRLKFSNEIIAELDHRVCREGQSLDQVTGNWLATHPVA
ncbi:glycine betaine ABC transporter substrate-binding protein [Rhodopirellula sp. P2]|uniref:glycine betaine ABC transporter substrate-binding protein n=1 Tax=Rhodopirellula sp. P2 TaxID=2127060 RepID=UPI00236880CB|nr:glycine betaine ABC transporter substrate-binding protein [Rhodopirellula sp. P2]WDQ16778.1 glycine betaine ABC transporter substrate-binding protein [Rhodopirellula sp. P2]